MILSIVIPVYKVEKYLEKCIESCINQDVSSDLYEIIIIDDGSPDHSGEIADKYYKVYNNVRVIHQNNRGLSGTRNVGISLSKGDYIWFIDSDDWIESNCLNRILAQLCDIDVLLLQFRKVYEDGRPAKDNPFCVAYDNESGKSFLKRSLFPHPAQFAIYNKNFLVSNNLFFVEGIYHEDSEFKPRVLYYAKRIKSDAQVSYNYLQRAEGSITAQYSTKRGRDMIFAAKSICSFSKEFELEDQVPFNKQISIDINEVRYGIPKLLFSDAKTLINNLSHEKCLFIRMMKANSVKYFIEGLTLYAFPRVSLLFHYIVNKLRRKWQ